jgi:hypothetical protein
MIQKRLTIDKLGTGGMVIHSVATGNATPRVNPAQSCHPVYPILPASAQKFSVL